MGIRPARLKPFASAAENAAGQAVWAAGQMAVLILLSHMGLQRLIGMYAAGLGVFTVVTLFLGLNLRVALSTDRAGKIGLRTAVAARLIACLVALPMAVGSIALMNPSAQEFLAASLLVSARIPDQLSELVLGVYVRDDRRRAISRSYLYRGATAIAVVAAGWTLGWPVVTTAALMLAAPMAVTLAHDVWPEWSAGSGSHEAGSMAQLVRETSAISLYPALDSLHSNSLRFSLVLLVGSHFYGVIAIAQVLFTPFQILMMAAGFGYLHEARTIHEQGGGRRLKRHVQHGLMIGGAISLAFVGLCMFLPAPIARLLFADSVGEAGPALMVVAIAYALQPFTSYLSFCVVTSVDRSTYLRAPVVGLVVAWAGTAMLLLGGRGGRFSTPATTALVVAAIFAASYAARLAYSLWGIRKIIRHPQPVLA